MDWWSLKTQQENLKTQYRQTVASNEFLQVRIKQARHSDKFIERQVREKLDLLKSDEIVFIFENDSKSETPQVNK